MIGLVAFLRPVGVTDLSSVQERLVIRSAAR
jgi:hypothetical protein